MENEAQLRFYKKPNFKYIILLSVFLLFFILSFFQIRNYLDDDYILRLFEEEYSNNLWIFLSERYYSWSSRFIIDSATIMFYKVPWLWNIIMPLVMTLFSYSIYKIIGKTSWLNMVISVSIAFIYPAIYSYEVGWITTSLNYIFVVTFILYIISILLRLYRREKIYWFSYILSILALIFASNEEIASIALVLISLTFIVMLIKKGTYKNALPYVVLSISLIMLIISATCPGNSVRYQQEIGAFYADFDSLNIFQKAFNGLFRASSSSIFEPNISFLLLGAVLIIICFCKKTNNFTKIISFLPFTLSLLFSMIFKMFPKDYSPYVFFHKFLFNTMRDTNICSYCQFYFEIAIFLISVFSIIYVILKTINNKNTSLVLLLVLLLGFGTQIGIAFSPQIGYLWYRTDAYFAVCMLVVTSLLFADIFLQRKKAISIISLSFLTIFAISMILFNICSYPSV